MKLPTENNDSIFNHNYIFLINVFDYYTARSEKVLPHIQRAQHATVSWQKAAVRRDTF